MVKALSFGGYNQYIIENGKIRLTLMDIGASVVGLEYDGVQLVLGYPDAEGYLNGKSYVGTVVGRYANRIGGARFSLNGKEYVLSANENGNQLHSGDENLSCFQRKWSAECGDNSVKFSILYPDGDNGFPGNLKASAEYTVYDDSVFLVFEGETDMPTVFAPTNHAYFSFSPKDVRRYRLRLESDGHLELDKGNIPTGRVLPNTGDFDFSDEKTINGDFDDCFILNSEHALTVSDNGICLDMYTDFPALQVYTGRYLEPYFGAYAGLALEPEFCPDSPNKPEFPSCVLNPGEHFKKYIRYCFSKK